MPEEDELTPEDVQYVENYGEDGYYPRPEEKPGIFTFLNKLLRIKDTSKVSNLELNELNSVRCYQSAAQFANTWGLQDVSLYLTDEAEILLATALSKKGFLVNAATISRKDVKLRGESKTKTKSAWFKKNEEAPGGEE